MYVFALHMNDHLKLWMKGCGFRIYLIRYSHKWVTYYVTTILSAYYVISFNSPNNSIVPILHVEIKGKII